MPKVSTLDGSKSHYQMIDVGCEGKVLWRKRPCHECEGCFLLDAQRIMTECKNNEYCGKAEYVTLKTV